MSNSSVDNLEFTECDTCKERPNSPFICQGCAHNRYTINRLKEEIQWLRPEIKKVQVDDDPEGYRDRAWSNL